MNKQEYNNVRNLVIDIHSDISPSNVVLYKDSIEDTILVCRLISKSYYYTIPEGSKSITQVVHFQDNAGGNDIFQKKCGTCHKALTSAGALGTSEDAPNVDY